MSRKYTIKLSKICFTYHIDKGKGYFSQSLPMEVSIDVLTEQEANDIKQRIFEALTIEKTDCVLLTEK